MPATIFNSSTVNSDVQTDVVLQESITGYSDEAYTNAKKLNSTGIVGSNPDINADTETFIGQARWNTPIDPAINIASLTDSSDGALSDYGTNLYKYIKTVRTHGARRINMKQVVTQVDGLAKIGRDFGETRAQDEHNSILATLKGVAASELFTGTDSGGAGGQTFDNDPLDPNYGFYVDLGSSIVTAATTANQGAQRAEAILNAFGMAYKDFEPEYAYLITSPETYASFRSANLVDSDRVTDGNVTFNTIFQGKFRLLQTRANQGFSAAEKTMFNLGGGVDIAGSKTSFIVLPGSIENAMVNVPMPTEIERKAAAYAGGGTSEIWFRWGGIYHPRGYSWAGAEDSFVSDYTSTTQAALCGAVQKASGVNHVALSAATAASGVHAYRGVWKRTAQSALSLGILPVFHN